ncbi:MAG: tRNA (N(6)-L-threonylcarbamoyladenosine(37)-C(2))-methylthiotransferase MtaB [Anaerolineae bacterium]|nr:tRNA (N(6)-L-threonylcarbamoyladenosine(37)-C(2))-methylthiotransferase MtaB [Anaerolineae bacterium]
MKVHLKTLGCRLNQSEIDSMARQFTAQGHSITDDAEEAALFVVNTCAVTQEATRSSRQLIYRLHRANPDAQIAVTGCYAHLSPDEIGTMPGVTSVIDNFDKSSLVSIVTGEPLAVPELHDREPLARQALIGALGKTRAFIKVQDGCDRHCSFCVTRLARGEGRSRDMREIIAEIQELSAAGYREAVLTGVHLGSYGDDLGQTGGLRQLVATILAETDIPRVRLSSLEPWGITDGFFALWDDPRMGKHLHLPLQSGCDATLKRMIRRTTQHEFRAIVEAARANVPDLSITTDVIVGFPGETDDEFAVSKAFIEDMQFAGMHIFRYSQRPGTAAARLPNHVSEAVMKQRSDSLHAISQRDEGRFAARYVDTAGQVLWEAISGSTAEGFINNGYTDNFIRVRCIAPRVLTDHITDARLLAWDASAGVMDAKLA